MTAPEQMVLISLFAFFIAIFIFFFYRYIFPKKKLNPYLVIFLLSILPVISIFRPGTYESGDLSFHATQAISFYNSLKEGILIPRWGEGLNGGYGYPAFMFIYILPYYLISFFHFVGFSFLLSTKLLLTLSFIVSGFAMFLWIREEINEKAGLIASIFYLYSPYHLVDLHFRVDIGEVVSFAIIPFAFLSVKRAIDKNSLFYFLLFSLVFALLILSHPAISLASVFFLTVYSLFRICYKKKEVLFFIKFIFFSLLGTGLSAFYWLPTFDHLQYTHQPLYSRLIEFPAWQSLIFSPWRAGLLFQGPTGQLSFVIGYVQLMLVAAAIIFIIQKKIKYWKHLVFFVFLFFLTFFMMLSISQPIWQNLPLFKNFQFSWRLLFYQSLFTSVISSVVLIKTKKAWLIAILCFLTVITTILNWGNRKNIPEINDQFLKMNLSSTHSMLAQAATKWTDPNSPWPKERVKTSIEVLNGKLNILNEKRSINKHLYEIHSFSNSRIRENTWFFPGWTLYVNSTKTPIEISKGEKPGIIELNLSEGVHQIKLQYEPRKSIKNGENLSILSFLLLIILFYQSKPFTWNKK